LLRGSGRAANQTQAAGDRDATPHETVAANAIHQMDGWDIHDRRDIAASVEKKR